MKLRVLLVAVSAMLASQLARAEARSSVVYKSGRSTMNKQSNGKAAPTWSLSYLLSTSNEDTPAKPIGLELEFEFVKASHFHGSSDPVGFGPGERVEVAGAGYNIGFSYIPALSDSFQLRITPYIGLTSEALSASDYYFSYNASNLGMRLTLRPKAWLDNVGLLTEYRVSFGHAKIAGEWAKYVASSYVAGLVYDLGVN
jgi:hypothetical protein